MKGIVKIIKREATKRGQPRSNDLLSDCTSCGADCGVYMVESESGSGRTTPQASAEILEQLRDGEIEAVCSGAETERRR